MDGGTVFLWPPLLINLFDKVWSWSTYNSQPATLQILLVLLALALAVLVVCGFCAGCLLGVVLGSAPERGWPLPAAP